MAWSYFSLQHIKEPLILHFTNAAGILQVGPISELMKFGVWGLVIAFVNFSLAYALAERDLFIARFIAGATFFFAILIFLGFAAIISVN